MTVVGGASPWGIRVFSGMRGSLLADVLASFLAHFPRPTVGTETAFSPLLVRRNFSLGIRADTEGSMGTFYTE